MHNLNEILEDTPYRADFLTIQAKKETEFKSDHHIIIFVRDQSVTISTPGFAERKLIHKGYFFLLPSTITCFISCSQECNLLYLEIPNMRVIYKHFLYQSTKVEKVDLNRICSPLKIVKSIDELLNMVTLYMEENKNQSYLMGLKSLELFILFKFHYTKEIMQAFFSPVL